MATKQMNLKVGICVDNVDWYESKCVIVLR
jgi:hypothetical protein